jgi:DNA-binding HxlR family transcriptional regulator
MHIIEQEDISMHSSLLYNRQVMARTQTGAAVLRNIADEKSWELFRTIAQGTLDSKNLKSNTKLTRKQYYSRLSRMTRSGLVTKKSGRYTLTNFGKIVQECQLTIENALENYWKLKAIDSLEISNELPKEERLKLIDTLLGNEELKEILVKGGSPIESPKMKTNPI